MSAKVNLRMWLMQKTDAAVKVADRANPHVPRVGCRIEWLPRSQIDYSRTEPATVAGELPAFVFTLPAWLVQRRNLGKFEIDGK